MGRATQGFAAAVAAVVFGLDAPRPFPKLRRAMQGLLDAIRNNRLHALSGTDKAAALAFLAGQLRETAGVPEDLATEFAHREAECNTGVGDGLAVPHVRATAAGSIACVAGWAENGLEYDASDGEPVRLVVMYLVPDCCKNEYLKEIAGLIRALLKHGGTAQLAGAPDLDAARRILLAWA
jgi:PTS system fructose-specific IIC component